MANEAILKYGGSATTVISLTATVSDGRVVGGQTEFDNSTLLYPQAVATLTITDAFGAAPNGSIDLYMVRGDIDSTTDGTALGYGALTEASAQNDPEYAEYCGGWFANVNEAFRMQCTISLMGVKKARFYIMNNTGTTLVYSANAITVKIEPLTVVPGA